ncbi:hypothetical protein EHW67_12985 [Arenibacter aquaticus]|uniref:Ester cyclase n=1 Tax=Arenibacter aquaticus TaxID=2489054 RepID=A0A430K1X7_9FLAO|nr:ester cyclase [Arenibacter aquaticus]RTE53090.1 hypothetical protein EHW67_12985 [Arenibacter aquaticus]
MEQLKVMKMPHIPLLLIVLCWVSCNNNPRSIGNSSSPKNKTPAMINGNPNLKASIDAYLSIKNPDTLNMLVTDNYVRNMNGIPVVTNKSELKARLNLYFTGFPDYHIAVSHSIICDSQGYINWVFSGTHTGLFGDVAATGKKIKINGFSHLYFNKQGQLYQEDIFYNELEFLQQLGYSLTTPNLK